MATSKIMQPSYGSLFVIEVEDFAYNVGANTWAARSKPISKAGYYPLGVVGWDLATTSGSASAQHPLEWRVADRTTGSGYLYSVLTNTSGSTYQGTLKLHVLWQKAV